MKAQAWRARARWTAVLAAGALTAVVAPGGVAGATTACTAYQLPGLPGGGGIGEVIVVTADGLYGGDAIGADGHPHAVYWSHTGADLTKGWTITRVPSPLVDDFIGDINRHGLMVGTGTDPSTGAGVGYVYDLASGALTLLPGLGGGDDYDRRINDAGVVAGTSADTRGTQHAVTWAPPYRAASAEPAFGGNRSVGTRDYAQDKTGSSATGINNKGQVVGAGFNGGHLDNTSEFARNHVWEGAVTPLLQPIQWEATGAPHRLPTGNGQGKAWAINDAGLVVGSVADAQTFTARPAAWVNGSNVDMGAPADIVFGNAFGLSQGGWAAGTYVEGDGSTARAFTWDLGHGFRTLDPPAGFTNSWSHGASDVLKQVGGGADAGGDSVPVVWQC